MKFKQVLGEYRYAVAVRENGDLWLALWIKRSHKGEFFVMYPRVDREWDVHASYHLHGQLHIKSGNQKKVETKVQPLNGVFRGTVDVGTYSGHDPKVVGEVCDPKDFNSVIDVAPGVLMPDNGSIAVELVEPGLQPTVSFAKAKIIEREVFRDFVPWLVVTIWTLS